MFYSLTNLILCITSQILLFSEITLPIPSVVNNKRLPSQGLFIPNGPIGRIIVHSYLKIKYSISARQLACQNMMVAVLFISFIRLMVPLTIFEKPLFGLDKNLHLLLARGVGLGHHLPLFKVSEEAFDRGGVI